MVTSSERRRGWRRGPVVLAAVAVAGLPAVRATAAGQAVDSGTVGWDGARWDAKGQALVVAFTGGSATLTERDPCWSGYRADVVEGPTTVIVTVVARTTPHLGLGPNVGCTLIGYHRTLRVRLSSPLGARRLVDGASGASRPVFAGPTLRTPHFLPHGWALLDDYLGFPGREGGASWSQTRGPPGDPGRCGRSAAPIELVQGPADAMFPYGLVDTAGGARRRVGRSNAQVWVDRTQRHVTVEWVDRGTGFILQRRAVCPGDPTPRIELLLRVAASVR